VGWFELTAALRGIVHAHSDYSHDGASDLAELAAMLRRKQLNFALLTEHVEDLSSDCFARYVGDCQDHSTPDLLLVPGLEYTFETVAGPIEVLLIGPEAYVEAEDPADLWNHRLRDKLLAILPHPVKFGPLSANLLAEFDLIEVWNLRYDGGGFPPSANIELFERVRSQGNAFAACGADYHEPGDDLDMLTVVDGGVPLEFVAVAQALKSGAFHSEYRNMRLPADLRISRFARCSGLLRRSLRQIVYRAGRWVANARVVKALLPRELKAGIRKVIR
jgi:hypothetical protein